MLNDLCDLYLPNPVISDEFKYVRIFDKTFIYEEGKEYCGYLNITVERIRMLDLIVEFRKRGLTVYSVPIDYQNASITKREAYEIANKYANENEFLVGEDAFYVSNEVPLFWAFPYTDKEEKIVGGILRFDRLDGHHWSAIDYRKYIPIFCIYNCHPQRVGSVASLLARKIKSPNYSLSELR